MTRMANRGGLAQRQGRRRRLANLPGSHTVARRYAQMAMTDPDRSPSASYSSTGRLRRIGEWSVDPTLLAGIAWQDEAFAIYRAIGQVRKVENVKANTLAGCDLRLVEYDEQGNAQETTDPAALETFRALQGPDGDYHELMRMFALLADIAGEAFLLGTPTVQDLRALALEEQGDSAGLVWEFVSRQEVRGDRQTLPGIQRERYRDTTGALAMQPRAMPPGTFIGRWHQRDPEYSEQPDSPLRSVLPDAQEYLKLRDVVAGSIRSHMSAEILLVPKDPASDGAYDETIDDTDQDDNEDPFMRDLINHMSAPNINPRDPASFVPLVIEFDPGEYEAAKQIRYVSPNSKPGEWAIPLREEKLHMIAQSLDAPPEEQEGMTQINHWGIYSLDQKFNSKWVIPRGEQLARWLTANWLWDMLELFGGKAPGEVRRWGIELDPSNITAKADKGVTATRLGDRGLLSADEQLKANGFDPDQKPDEEETRRRFVADLVLRNPTQMLPVFAEYLGLSDVADLEALAKVLELGGPAGKGGPVGAAGVPTPGTEQDEGVGDETSAGDAGGGSDLGPVTGDDPQSTGQGSPANAPTGVPQMSVLIAELATMADMAAERALEKANNRLHGMSGRKNLGDDLTRKLTGRRPNGLLSVLSTDDLGELGTSADDLLGDAWDTLTDRASRAVAGFLEAVDCRPSEVDMRTAELVDCLVAQCDDVLRRTRGGRTSTGELIPPNLIASTVEEFVGSF
jgi:hypothetical protein